jgi:hypothetical protein
VRRALVCEFPRPVLSGGGDGAAIAFLLAILTHYTNFFCLGKAFFRYLSKKPPSD